MEPALTVATDQIAVHVANVNAAALVGLVGLRSVQIQLPPLRQTLSVLTTVSSLLQRIWWLEL